MTPAPIPLDRWPALAAKVSAAIYAVRRDGVGRSPKFGRPDKPRRQRKQRARTENRFRTREVTRAVKAAKAAGEHVERVEIDPVSGKITVIVVAAPDPAADTKAANPFHTAPVHDPNIKTRKKRT